MLYVYIISAHDKGTKWTYGTQSEDSKGRPVWAGRWGYWAKTGYFSKVSMLHC